MASSLIDAFHRNVGFLRCSCRIFLTACVKISKSPVPTKKTIVLTAVIVSTLALLAILFKPARREESTTNAQATASAPRSNSETAKGSVAPIESLIVRPLAPSATMPAIDAPLAEQLPKLRALSNSGNVEATCKLSVLLEDCANNASIVRFRRAHAARQRARDRLSGQTQASPRFSSSDDTNALASSVETCKVSAPDFYAEQAELLLAQAKNNQPQALFKLIRLPQESLIALALERPELLKEITEQINQHVLNPGAWVAFSREHDLQALASAFGSTNLPASAWHSEQFEPNQALGYLYLLLASANRTSELDRLRRVGAQNATPENRAQRSMFHALVETEKQLDATTRDAMQSKAKQLYPVLRAMRSAQSKRYNQLKSQLDLDAPGAVLKKSLLECEQPI